MSTYVPGAVQEGLDAARVKRLKTASKLRLETPDGYFRVLRLWENGFSVAADDVPHLRGYVDLYDGPTQLFQCLIVASQQEAGETSYEFKRMTAVSRTAPRDYVAGEEAPVALLGSSVLTA